MGKTLLILGASSDCGMELIRNISEKYDLIYAHYAHMSGKLDKLKSELGEKLVLIEDDFRHPQAGQNVLKAIEEKGIWPEHVLHLPALSYQNYKFGKIDWATFEDSMNISLKSAVLILQKVLTKLVKEKKEGRIVFMLSSVTDNIPPKYVSHYVTTKYAMLGLMKALSAEYADKNIMINGVSPSMMDTKFLADIPDLVIEQNAAASNFGRNLTVSEVIPTLEFLLSDGAGRITGQNIVISGGNA